MIWSDFGTMVEEARAYLAESGWRAPDTVHPEWTLESRMKYCRRALETMPGTALVVREAKLLSYTRDDPSHDDPTRQLARDKRMGSMPTSAEAGPHSTGDDDEGARPKKIMTVPRIAFEQGMRQLALLQPSAPNTPRSGPNDVGLDSSLSGKLKMPPSSTPRGYTTGPVSTIHTPPHPSRTGLSQLGTPRQAPSGTETPRYLSGPNQASLFEGSTNDVAAARRIGDGLPRSATARSLTGTQYSGQASRHATVPCAPREGPTSFRKVVAQRAEGQLLRSTETSLSGSYDEEDASGFEHPVVAENQIDPIAQYLEEQLEFIGCTDADIESNIQQYDRYMESHSRRRDDTPPPVVAGPTPEATKQKEQRPKPSGATSPRAPFRLY